MARGPGRTGRPYRRARQRLIDSKAPCHICGRVIDYTLPGSDPMGFAMDHVVPLHFGGHPTAPTNTRASHRSCNRTKGTKALDDVQIMPRSRQW
jgi:5-methylcytosine-specific restriction endonuclease McrA